jgi:hypothetical protein
MNHSTVTRAATAKACTAVASTFFLRTMPQ